MWKFLAEREVTDLQCADHPPTLQMHMYFAGAYDPTREGAR